MGLAEFFSWGSGGGVADEMPDLFPLGIDQKLFVETEIKNIYSKILTDVVERTEGLGEDNIALMWDNCLASESRYGLISLLSCAMLNKTDIFLVLDKSTGVLREATAAEQAIIKADYKAQAESSTGVYISFKDYCRTDMIRVYSCLEYCTVASLNKTMNLSKAVQIKINDLRGSVALIDAEKAKAQAKLIADALKAGKDCYMDAKDVIETAVPNIDPTKASMELLNQKRAFYLNMPASYITGELNSGLGDTGQADAKATERGLRGYFVSIIKPVCKALFGKELTFKSEDFLQLATNIEALKTFDLVSEEFMSAETKLELVNKLFGLPEGTAGGPKDVTPAPIVVAPGQLPPKKTGPPQPGY